MVTDGEEDGVVACGNDIVLGSAFIEGAEEWGCFYVMKAKLGINLSQEINISVKLDIAKKVGYRYESWRHPGCIKNFGHLGISIKEEAFPTWNRQDEKVVDRFTRKISTNSLTTKLGVNFGSFSLGRRDSLLCVIISLEIWFRGLSRTFGSSISADGGGWLEILENGGMGCCQEQKACNKFDQHRWKNSRPKNMQGTLVNTD